MTSRHSIAVLPFVNISPDRDNEYFSDGVTEEIFILQDEIAQIIAERINSKIRMPVAHKEGLIENTEALDHYLKGQYLLNKFIISSQEDIIRHFEQALAIDPNFEKAYKGLCDAYTWLSSVGVYDPVEGNKKIEENIRSLMRLNPNTPEVYMLISGKNFWLEWNIPMALENINRAIELKPGGADGLKTVYQFGLMPDILYRIVF